MNYVSVQRYPPPCVGSGAPTINSASNPDICLTLLKVQLVHVTLNSSLIAKCWAGIFISYVLYLPLSLFSLTRACAPALCLTHASPLAHTPGPIHNLGTLFLSYTYTHHTHTHPHPSHTHTGPIQPPRPSYTHTRPNLPPGGCNRFWKWCSRKKWRTRPRTCAALVGVHGSSAGGLKMYGARLPT
jgi:hypothetical protein